MVFKKTGKFKFILAFLFGGLVVVLASIGVIRSQVQEVGGLAVAQSSTRWNYLKDASVGDDVTNGVGAFSLYLFDGTNFDRARGDTTYGLDVDVTRLSGLSTSLLADNMSNPTTLSFGSFLMLYDGTTWDRALVSVHGDNLTTSQGLNVASFTYGFDGTNWDRVKVSGAGSLKIDPEQSSSISNGQVSVGSTATLIVSSGSRKSVIVKNIDNTNDVFIGNSSVTTTNGFRLTPGQQVELDKTTAAVYGIASTACQVAFIVQ